MPFSHYHYKNMAKFMVEYIKGLFLFTPYNVKMVRFEVKVKMGLTVFEVIINSNHVYILPQSRTCQGEKSG
jgi:hypothetical protein